MTPVVEHPRTPTAAPTGNVERLRELSFRALARMFRPDEASFAFRLRRGEGGQRLEGVSRRYTSIVLIGFAGERPGACEDLIGVTASTLCGSLLADVREESNLGDVALLLWAARALDHDRASDARVRLEALDPRLGPHSTVELAWALTALSLNGRVHAADELPLAIAERLLTAFNTSSALFAHRPGSNGRAGLRGHVGCFADQVYPIQALSHYYRATGDVRGLDAARRCARQICALQGPAGQWWWHYDVRTGRVVEGYPVYSVHQDAMAPMALFDLTDACGEDFGTFVARGMAWLMRPPETAQPLVDVAADLIWRKVARHEPGKLSRTLHALASRMHRSLRAPLVDRLFPPGFIDYECRPYHLGWLLHAWSPARREHWPLGDWRDE